MSEKRNPLRNKILETIILTYFSCLAKDIYENKTYYTKNKYNINPKNIKISSGALMALTKLT